MAIFKSYVRHNQRVIILTCGSPIDPLNPWKKRRLRWEKLRLCQAPKPLLRSISCWTRPPLRFLVGFGTQKKGGFRRIDQQKPWKSVGFFHENYGIYEVHRQIDANRFDWEKSYVFQHETEGLIQQISWFNHPTGKQIGHHEWGFN